MIEQQQKELGNAITELSRTTDKMNTHIGYLSDDLKDVKVELKSIIKVLETQIIHTEKLKHMEDNIDELNQCSLEKHNMELKITKLETEQVNLIKEVGHVRDNLNKTIFVVIAAILASIFKIVFGK